jgi:hypothetical protein
VTSWNSLRINGNITYLPCPASGARLTLPHPPNHQATPRLKKKTRVGRFFWKNLEAKPPNFGFA